jgi:hypothetical protein
MDRYQVADRLSVGGRRHRSRPFHSSRRCSRRCLPPLPTPWGIRVGLAARGIDTGPLPLPVSAARTARIAAFRKWLPEWLVQHGLDRSVDAAAKITRR